MTKPRPRIMVVDDEPDHAECMKLALKHFGIQADAFSDPEMALAHLAPGKYDIVITDIKMPKMSGFEFTRRISSMDKDTKIILMTAFHITSQDFDKFGSSARVDALIKKPVGMTKLRDHISVLLGDYKEGRWSNHYSIASVMSGTTASMFIMSWLQDLITVLA